MYIYGKNIVKEAIINKRTIYELYLDNKFNDNNFLNLLKEHNIKYSFKDKGELNNLSENGVHQGVVAGIKPYEYKNLEDILDSSKRQRFLILDEITDPHNLGAILRTAEATNLDGIIMSKKHQVPLNGTVAKVSSGAIEHVNVILVGNINQTITKLKENNVLVVGTSDKATNSYLEIPKDLSVAIILGNEGTGIRHLVKENCDILVKIPMYGKVNSLNVSVAAALMLYASL
ncbi:23S rRNA (guanosine(2251)-2'-O)-methyltransferase RlmB [Haploplasma modicum]|jgi:23S rRNA (guanosine2251-2'-O)-methyltransferase|uniref:23S rRNA (guanosine(2251)-2'-O)-methyltransferase RlmB n=1 Tax=Haploplasma modicum TaxID=2150 RepID=UPI00047EF959|nr:23S rRNA (guanosine(2251)-2'-O)-methyltransferase RlmB [Haploplasma modicum]MCR1809179.1 23S rRNA (guanosine(2251)-2'-O)-methyltransferase RlmB [Haploplasma modicum]